MGFRVSGSYFSDRESTWPHGHRGYHSVTAPCSTLQHLAANPQLLSPLPIAVPSSDEGMIADESKRLLSLFDQSAPAPAWLPSPHLNQDRGGLVRLACSGENGKA